MSWLGCHQWTWDPGRLDEIIAGADREGVEVLWLCGHAANALQVADRFDAGFCSISISARWSLGFVIRSGATRIAFELSTSDAVVRFVALGFGPAIVPRSATAARSDDLTVLELADPATRHPIGLVHRQPEPSAPSARAFLALLATLETPRSRPRGRRLRGL